MTKGEFCGMQLDEENTHYMNESTKCEDCLEEKTVLYFLCLLLKKTIFCYSMAPMKRI